MTPKYPCPASLWKKDKFSPQSLLIYMFLWSCADSNGITIIDKDIGYFFGNNFPKLGTIRSATKDLGSVVGYYAFDGQLYAWLPEVVGQGGKRDNGGYPFPTIDIVEEVLELFYGRPPSTKECQGACPGAYGKKRSLGVQQETVRRVFDAWVAGQQGNPQLVPALAKLIEGALRNFPPEDIILMFEWVYQSQDDGPKFLRGESKNNKTKYLGLSTLLKQEKVLDRILAAKAWKESQQEIAVAGDIMAQFTSGNRRRRII